jgi:Skp family chaperone for outer membrane proteins
MTKFALGAALAALSIAIPAAAPAQNAGQILVVDVNRISNECTACRAAQATLRTQANSAQQRQQTLTQQLQTTGQPLQTAIAALNGRQPDAALNARIQAFETQRTNAAQEIQRVATQIQSTEANVNLQITNRLRTVLEQIRARRNAAIVVARGATWAHAPASDITTEALAALNQQLPTVSVTPLPQQQQQQQRPQGR